MKYLKIEYRLLVYFTSFTVCSGDIKKKKKTKKNSLKTTSQLFRAFFSIPPTPPLTQCSHMVPIVL